jgi:hypothetical protein
MLRRKKSTFGITDEFGPEKDNRSQYADKYGKKVRSGTFAAQKDVLMCEPQFFPFVGRRPASSALVAWTVDSRIAEAAAWIEISGNSVCDRDAATPIGAETTAWPD